MLCFAKFAFPFDKYTSDAVTSDEFRAISARQAADCPRQAIDNMVYPLLMSLRLSENLFEGGTGCHDWEAGFLLAEFIKSHPDICKGKVSTKSVLTNALFLLILSLHCLTDPAD